MKSSDTLDRYPVETTFREYLANADDCEGASHISWMLDQRSHQLDVGSEITPAGCWIRDHTSWMLDQRSHQLDVRSEITLAGESDNTTTIYRCFGSGL
jgi:hypothetical protein